MLQSVQLILDEFEPTTLPCFPGGHLMQVAIESAPLAVEYDPAPHFLHIITLKNPHISPYLPAGHHSHFDLPGLF